MRRKFIGASLAQYAIITALVALAVIPAYFILGQTIVGSFQNFLSYLQNTGPSVASIPENPPVDPPVNPPVNPPANPPGTPGPLGGTPDKPVRSCSGGTCTIDFGSFTVEGIRDNFPDFVETNGGAGGTEDLAAILDAIDQAVKEQGLLSEDSQIIKDLANKGHLVADIEGDIEGNLRTMRDTGDGSVYATYNGNTECMADGYGVIDSEFKPVLDAFNSQYSATTQDQQNVKTLVNYLANEIIDISVGFNTTAASLFNYGSTTAPPVATINAALQMDVSNLDDLDAQIICHTGNGTDLGAECN